MGHYLLICIGSNVTDQNNIYYSYHLNFHKDSHFWMSENNLDCSNDIDSVLL